MTGAHAASARSTSARAWSGWADAALGGADLLAGAGGALAQGVDERVVGEDHVGAIRHEEPAVDDVPARLERADLGDQHAGVDDHPLRHHAAGLRPQDAAGDEPDDDGLVADHERVPGVRPPREAHDHVGRLGVEVDHLALALVPPLRADDHHCRHR
jgi:hypothetical protein